MRRIFASIAGNAALCRRIGTELAQESFSHAHIIEGPDGIGKRTLATEIAMALACENRTSAAHPLPCGVCAGCRKIREQKSPDVIWVDRPEGKSFLSVDIIRELREDVHKVPNDLAFKVYIICNAHTMNQQAQNALLLTLEEPPPFVLFLLLCEDSDALLETIRSRAPILRMQPVSEEDMRDYLLSPERDPKLSRTVRELFEKSPDEAKAILRMSNGCLGKAIELLDEAKRAPMLDDRATVQEICHLLAARTKQDSLFTALLSLGKDREEVAGRLVLLQTALRDLLLLGLSEEAPLLFFTDREAAIALSDRFAASRLLAAQNAINQAIEALGDNANLRLSLVQLLNHLSA